MDCEGPFLYTEYDRLVACREVLTAPASADLLGPCETSQEFVVTGTIALASGVTYTVRRSCANVLGQPGQDLDEAEVTE